MHLLVAQVFSYFYIFVFLQCFALHCAWHCTCLLPKSFPRLMCSQSTLGTARHMEDNFGLDFLRRNFHISCFDFSAYFKLRLVQSWSSSQHVDIYFHVGCVPYSAVIVRSLCIFCTEPCVPNQSFCLCIYGGRLWSDFCAGHFVAGFSLGGWQGRSDSPTGA